MNGTREQSAQREPARRDGCVAGIIRITWMAFGNLALFLCAIMGAQRTAPSAFDFVFAGLVLGLAALRYVDIARYHGETAEGEPATLAHWRRYVLRLVVAAAATWGLARLAASRGLI